MSSVIKKIISDALDEAIEEGSIKTKKPVIVERPKKEGFGDFSTNIAMLLSPFEFQRVPASQKTCRDTYSKDRGIPGCFRVRGRGPRIYKHLP